MSPDEGGEVEQEAVDECDLQMWSRARRGSRREKRVLKALSPMLSKVFGERHFWEDVEVVVRAVRRWEGAGFAQMR